MFRIIKKLIKRWPWLFSLAQKLYPFATAISALLHWRRGVKDHILSTWSMLNGRTSIAGRPINITIEPTNLCNLRCPVCETGAGIRNRKDVNMSFEQFVIIVDKVSDHVNTLMFYFMGEPFLNGQAYNMVRYAKNKGIPWITTCTNGDLVDPEKLVHCGLDEISFQIGGMTQKTHEIYRVNSKLERVLHNLSETIRLRKAKRIKMRIMCGFILMRHNEDEVDAFYELMAKMGVDEASVIDPCVRTVEQGRMFLPSSIKHWYYDSEAFSKGLLRPRVLPQNACPWIWYSLVVLGNGDIVPCCRDPKGEYVMGNLLAQDLEEIWNAKAYVEFRKRILIDQGCISICRLCSGYPASVIN